MISPHAADHVGTDELATLRDWKPRVATVFNLALQHAHEIKQATPNTLLIGRPYVPDEEMEYRILMDPNAAADFAADMVFRSPGHGAIDFWQGPANEVAHTSPEHLREHNTFALRYMAHLHYAKLKACILNPSVGWPPTFEEDGGASWREVFPALRAALAGGSILGLHAYGKKSLGSLIVDRQYLINRFEIGAWPYFPDDLKALQYAYTEYGTDELNYGGPREGWIGPYGGDAQAFVNELQEAIKPTLDKPCLGAAVYTFGAENKAMWGSYDIRGECAKLMARTTWPVAKYTPAAPVVPPPPPKVEGPMIRVLLKSGTVQTIPVEEYLRGVVPSEMPASWMPHALMAQAVAARTYARYNIAHPKHHFQGADVCTEVHCQVYNPAKIAATTDQAIQATVGVMLWHDRKPINAVYSARCGGKTASGKERWNVEVAYWQSVWCPCSPNNEPRHGHGVGLCQHGAQRLAQQGHDWPVILRHYYTKDVGIGKTTEEATIMSDTPLARWVGSPNHEARPPGTVIDSLIFHATANSSLQGVIDWFNNPQVADPRKRVSAHYTVAKNGERVQHVRENRVAWHAGASAYGGRSDFNRFSLGIELVNLNDGKDPFPKVQIDSAVDLALDMISRHPIRQQWVLAHYDISPGRKTDPRGLDIKTLAADRLFFVAPPPPAPPVAETWLQPQLLGLNVISPATKPGEPYWHLAEVSVIRDGRNQIHYLTPEDHAALIINETTGQHLTYPLPYPTPFTIGPGGRSYGVTPGRSELVTGIHPTGVSYRLWFVPQVR